MNLLPVARRELQLLARRPRAYWGRAVTALVVLLVSLGMLYAGFGGYFSPAMAGRNLFLILAGMAAAYVLIDGVMLTADCLSQEKRDGTLGLLFLTDLHGYDIVAGKLISRAANAAYCLFGALPALGIGLFLGGVSGMEFLQTMVAVLNGLFFSAAFGMLVSAVSRHERQALGGALLGVLTLCVLVPLLGWGLSLYRGLPAVDPWFLIASPAGPFLYAIQRGGSNTGPGYGFTQTLAISNGLSWFFLAAASVIVPRAWREDNAAGSIRSKPRFFRNNPRSQASRRRLEHNPLSWADVRRRERGLGFYLVFLVFLLGCGLGWEVTRGLWIPWPVYAIAVGLLHFGLVYALALQACRGPGQDQRSGVLEILLTTPRGDDVYLSGRMLSLKRGCAGPVFLVLTADFGLMLTGCWQSGPLSWEWLGWIAGYVAVAFKLLLDLYTVSWVGIWQGLKTRDTGRALRKTLFYVFLVRWMMLLGLLAAVGLVTEGRLFQSAVGGFTAVAGYFAFLVMTALHFCGAAITDLNDNLRILALHDSDASSPHAPVPEVAGQPLSFAKARPVHSTARLTQG